MGFMDAEQGGRAERPKIVIYTTEVLGVRMAGPGIRALRFAEHLAPFAEVRLIAQDTAELTGEGFDVFAANGAALLEHVKWCDVLLMQSPILTILPEILDTDTIVIADLYDPFLLEQLQQGLYIESTDQLATAQSTVAAVNDMLRYSDFFICASEKQRDMWIGQLSSVGRLNPLTYRDDPSLRRLIDIVPFGVDETPATRTGPGMRGVVDGIGAADKVLLWGGGIYDWFDPITLVRAVARLSETHDDIRLFFLATLHANPLHQTMKMAKDAIELAGELGVLGSHVFFNDQWVAHSERANYFLDADVGISTHLDHLETAFSFRTRLLDYLWAGLPIINSAGDAFESAIIENGLGTVVQPGDQAQLEQAIEQLLYDDDARSAAAARVRGFAPQLFWRTAVTPLLSFAANPYRAADADVIRSSRVTGRADAAAASAVAAEAAAAAAAAAVAGDRALQHSRELQARVADLENSTSWRVTAPIRRVTALLARR